jgi:hypothetical protein
MLGKNYFNSIVFLRILDKFLCKLTKAILFPNLLINLDYNCLFL